MHHTNTRSPLPPLTLILTSISIIALGAFASSCTTSSSGAKRDYSSGGGVNIVNKGREQVEGDSGRRLVSGFEHTCALRPGGSVWCWGANSFGQLGDGTTIDSPAPREVPGLSGVVQITAGGYHTCARGQRGEVVCWGSNHYNQIGNGKKVRRQLSPSLVPSVGDAREVEAGSRHTCARLKDRRVICWGDNSVGQLGDGTSEQRLVPNHRNPNNYVLGIKDAVQLAAGADTTCARLRSGRVACWGDNQNKALGFGGEPVIFAPLEVPGLGDATRIVGGLYHMCALRRRANPVCWGRNANGELNPTGVAGANAHVAEMRGFDDAQSIAVGNGHICVLGGGGKVECWGDNSFGQLGIRTTKPQSKKKLKTVRGLDFAVSLSAGRTHTCALRKDQEVRCWGNNQQGQLGTGNTGIVASPTRAIDLESAVELASGSSHTCARLRSGEVACWGNNLDGRAGRPPESDVRTPKVVRGLKGATAVVAGAEHTCALLRGGKVVCWGKNTLGQLGGEPGGPSHAPVAVEGIKGAKALQVGLQHTCAEAGAGFMCWGNNQRGQLGADGEGPLRSVTLSKKLMRGGVRYMTSGRTSCVSSRKKGQVLCWGEPPLAADVENLAAPTPIEGLTGYTALQFGANHHCATSPEGATVCWGDGAYGQLGHGGSGGAVAPVPVKGLEGQITKLTLGESHTCALMADKRVACWGNNRYGQLGDGTTDDRLAPTVVPPLKGVVDVAAGANHTCALLERGEVWCWGQSGLGQLGDGSASLETAPLTVQNLPY